ncbi:hypothetical protein LPJ72_006335 [Coemansia sp. Benny D160-2]|nr:hypothetical protein LPJ72_006335 [Coemansia sp. Benny D160-2]
MDAGYNAVASAFVNSVQEGVMFENGEALAKLFVFGEKTISILSSKLRGVYDFDQYTVIMDNAVFAQFTAAYLAYVRDKPSADRESGHRLLCTVVELFTAAMAGTRGSWLVPAVRPVTVALCMSAQATYREMRDPAVYAQSASLLLRLLIDLLSETSDPLVSSKRLGSLVVAALLLQISLRTTAAPGAYASKALEVKAFWKSSVFSQRDRVSYSYWLGRYYLVCYYVDLARAYLEYAFNGCRKSHFHNKRAILRHLIAANIIRGRLPTRRLLEKYQMEPVYLYLSYHFSKGNLAGFQHALMANMDFFRSQGNYLLLLERTEILVYRNALVRLYRLNKGTERSSAVPYSDILVTLRLSSGNAELDVFEMESILTSLISQKLVLGYLFHHQKILNLSRKQPFPPIYAEETLARV